MSSLFLERMIASATENSGSVAMRVVGDDSQVYTFGEMLRQLRAVAFRLNEAGVEKGDRVALIGENHPCWAIAYLGTLYRGAVCVPLDPHGEIETLSNFIENSEAKMAFIGADFAEKMTGIATRLDRNLQTVVWRQSEPPASAGGRESGFKNVEFRSGAAPPAYAGGSDFSDWASTEFPDSFAAAPPTVTDDDTALLIYTSGTTGTPKGVPLTHGNITAELDGIRDVLRLDHNEKILSLLPLFHAYLQIVNLWVATTYGIEVGYLKELSPAALGDAMKQFRPTVLTTVPRLWYLFHKKIFDAVAAKPKAVQTLFRSMLAFNGFARDLIGIDLGKKLFSQVHDSFGGRLRIAVSAGSRFDDDVARDFHRLGFTIVQGYGLTETSGAATATFESDNRVGSVGKAMRGTEVKIDAPNNDGIGEVLIRGGVVFKGYYKNREATAEAFTGDGWFRTGDLGKFDSDGHLYIVGRAKDVIVLSSGKNVHPEDLEVHYLKTPLVEEMAIVGVRDEAEKRAGAERLAAVVVPDFEYLRQEKIANSREAIRYALDNLGRELPEYQRVRDYLIRTDPLPRTATRKIKRFELKKEIESGKLNGGSREPKAWRLGPDDAALLESTGAGRVVAAIKQNAKDADTAIHPDMNLEIDLGLDSLARAELFAALEHKFGVELDAEAVAKSLTVREVIGLVQQSEPGPAATGYYDIVPRRERDGSAVANDNESVWPAIIESAPTDVPDIRPVLKSRPLFTPFAFSVYKLFNLFCRVFMLLEVRGIENLRAMRSDDPAPRTANAAFLICPNHQSFLDPFVVCSTYPFNYFRDTFHVGAAMFFKSSMMRWISKMLQVVPIDQDTQLMRAMQAAAAGLKNGKILNIYPEGERAYDGRLHEFKKGAAILATELDLPILPVAIDGLYKVWPRRTMRIRPGKVKVRFGEPFYVKDVLVKGGFSVEQGVVSKNDGTVISREQVYEFAIEHLKSRIASMIDEMRRG